MSDELNQYGWLGEPTVQQMVGAIYEKVVGIEADLVRLEHKLDRIERRQTQEYPDVGVVEHPNLAQQVQAYSEYMRHSTPK